MTDLNLAMQIVFNHGISFAEISYIMYTFIVVHAYICMQIYLCIHTHMYTHTYMHTHTRLTQLGGLSLSHPDDLQHVDQAFHHSMTVQLEDIDIAGKFALLLLLHSLTLLLHSITV